MHDNELRQRIIDEFEFDPGFDAAHIGVAVENGIVMLTGHVKSCAQKLAAVSAARRRQRCARHRRRDRGSVPRPEEDRG